MKPEKQEYWGAMGQYYDRQRRGGGGVCPRGGNKLLGGREKGNPRFVLRTFLRKDTFEVKGENRLESPNTSLRPDRKVNLQKSRVIGRRK